MTAELSAEAKTALINVGTSRQGAVVPQATSARVLFELRAMNMIGQDNGLTRFGTIARQRAVSAALDAAFS